VAWAFCVIFYFLQYAVRSAPSVMLPELKSAFALDTLGLSSLIGLYYYTYSTFALIAGAALDRWGAKYPISFGTAILAGGIALFGLGDQNLAGLGRLFQGAGAAFAFTGAVYLAAHGFPRRYLATAIGITQCIGMLGGSVGQFGVAPLIHGAISWQSFWIYAGAVTFVVAIVLLFVTPPLDADEKSKSTIWTMFAPYKIVLSNPQTWLCGLSAGLLFLPTTAGSMVWGVSFLHEGWGLPFAEAVNRAAMVPFGWVIGAPALGYVADRMGLRKPALYFGAVLMLLSMTAILYLPPNSAPHYLLASLLGFGSGAAMIPYSIIKEANPDEVKGSATGAINFLVFVISAAGAPAFGWLLQKFAGGGALVLPDFIEGGGSMIAVIVVGGLAALFLKETGAAALKSAPAK
jgi:MFS family permease